MMENDFIEEDRDSNKEEDEELGDPTALSDDSSEEPEEDEEEARRIRENFIVDEEDSDEPSEDERQKKRRKRRKKARDAGAILEEDDLDLLEENTGRRVDRQRLTRIRRIRDSESPPIPSSSAPRTRAREEDAEFEAGRDIGQIWEVDEEDRIGGEPPDEEDMDMDDFIDDDEQDEGMAEEEREERRRERKRLEKERYRALGARPELSGIDAGAWDEIYEVFGDGTDYDWALDEDELPQEEEAMKSDLKFTDVFEPSEIKARMLTEEDDVIRLQDRPERMQLANSTLSHSASRITGSPISQTDLADAAFWITVRLSPRHERDFFRPDGIFQEFLTNLISAVQTVIELLFVKNLEVPYIFAHRRDYLNLFDPDQPSLHVEFLRREDLWRIYTLGIKYQALIERRKTLQTLYDRLQVSDGHFESSVREGLDSVESVADATEWIGLKYRNRKKDDMELRFHDDQEAESAPKKLPNRVSDYEIVKSSIISKLAEDFGIKSHEVIVNFRRRNTTNQYFAEDQDLPPLVHAEAFGDPNQERYLSPESLLQQARMLLATEIGKDPLLRKDVRELFKTDGLVTIRPTEKGLTKIDDHHPYNNFKYLRGKPIKLLVDSPQFLLILAAEAEHLVTVSIELSATSHHELQRSLTDAFVSNGYSDTVKAWNDQRALVIQEAVEKHLIPMGTKWIREWVRDEAQNNLARKCGEVLRQRIYVKGWDAGPTDRLARVVAVSWGKGDPQKDAITVVYLNGNGALRDNFKLDNLIDTQNKDLFKDLIARRNPAVIVVGGLSIRTTELVRTVKGIVSQQTEDMGGFDNSFVSPPQVKVIYAFDEVARIYQHSKRADEEFSALSLAAKYCVGIARYVQSPINEYAALGEDLAALTLDEEIQNMIPKEKLLVVLERVLVDVVNEMGVDVNRTVTDPYYKHLLPFVSGLGPRKAQLVIKKIASLGGDLTNRAQFIRGNIMTTCIFENAAGFLRISQNPETRLEKHRTVDELDLPDPLDDTRIHPADYELARKMAADALDLDEEDIQDEHSSYVVLQIKEAVDGARRLDELNLDDFAINMFRDNGDRKRHTLNTIRDELLRPSADRRPPYALPSDWDVLTMLSSETPRTLRVGLIVSVAVTRNLPHYVEVKLDSGLSGMINIQYLVDQAPSSGDTRDIVKRGQTLLGVIIDVKLDLLNDMFGLELSSRESDVSVGDANFRKVAIDEDFYDVSQAEKDKELLQRRKRSENDRTRRVIKHPNFHNFNSVQAEAYLSAQQRGDAIVRPSSKGADHLAVTWKVDEGLYQHIDVLDPNADVTKQTVGQRLIVDNGEHEFADLDELIVNYVQALARRVEELMSHEKYKRGSDEAIRKELNDYITANPSKSIYCFTLNRRRPGHFNIVFKANPASPVQVWPVRVSPQAYHLFDANIPNVPELCDAFKYQFIHRSSLGTNAGSKTPYAGRTPGHRTPGAMSIRQAGRTPNPYESAGPGGHVNPQRAAMIESTGGWGSKEY